LITDGINNVRDSEFAAELAELQAISPVFAIGIGAAVSPTQLNAIASDLEGIQTAFFYAQFTGQNIVQPLMLNMALYADSLHTPQVTPIPEPQTYAMLLAGLALLGFQARRRKNLRSAAA
jgi:hypothetical protein